MCDVMWCQDESDDSESDVEDEEEQQQQHTSHTSSGLFHRYICMKSLLYIFTASVSCHVCEKGVKIWLYQIKAPVEYYASNVTVKKLFLMSI